MLLSKLKPKFNFPKIKFKFPHIYRSFTAYLFWLFIIMLIILNAFHTKFFGFTTFSQIRYPLLSAPYDPKPHLSLGDYFLDDNNPLWAQKEYEIAQELYLANINQATKKEVLGISTPPSESWTEIQKSQNAKNEEIIFWKEILRNNPDYIFAYLKLASLHMDKNEENQSLSYLKTLLNHDPTNEIALKLLKDIEN